MSASSERVLRGISLGLALTAFWLALSGHYTAFLLCVGAGCVSFCFWIAHRMGVIDDEGQPIQLIARAPGYWAWLWVQIFKSSVQVTRLIWSPRLRISPVMTRVRSQPKSGAGIATFANSITLTPGTITTGVKDDVLTVHAVTRAGADDVESGEMNARVRAFEGEA